MRTFDELVARLRSPQAGGFGGIDATRVGEVVNDAIRRLASQSRWVTDERVIAVTVAGIDTYELGDDVIDVIGLKVGGSTRWQRASTKQMWMYGTGERSLNVNSDGAYAARFSATGERLLGLYPAPEADGLEIAGLVAVIPADIAGAQTPPFPDDHEETIMAFAKEVLYEEVDEDLNTASVHGQKARAAAEELRRRNNSQIGSGPIQAQILGVHTS